MYTIEVGDYRINSKYYLHVGYSNKGSEHFNVTLFRDDLDFAIKDYPHVSEREAARIVRDTLENNRRKQ
jgi:hypothetical protein